jgi:GT2 family glycosyltransferase
MTEDLKVSVIIPNWNGRGLLQKNLPAVLKAKQNPRNNILEIIVVDDKSKDDSVEFLKKEFPGQVRIVQHKVNRGFSATVNTGARSAKGDLLCSLNTDVVPSADCLVSVIPHFENAKVFAVSLHEKGYANAIGRFKNGFIEHAPGKEKEVAQQTFWVSGGSGVFRRNIWMKLGGLDEKILPPFYWEDVDLGYRAQKRGYLLFWEPKANVVHEHESTINIKNFKRGWTNLIKERNQLLVIWKNITSANMFKKHSEGLFKRVIKHPGYIRVLLAALMKLGSVLKARAKEKKESIVSDEAVFARFA